MKCCILMGSPRKNGNTIALTKPLMEALAEQKVENNLIWLYDKDIKGCIGCRACQKDWTKFGCIFKDDGQEMFDQVLASDLIILASPIYSWYCTAPMKALMDRLVYGMNKYYGDDKKGPALWAGKHVAIVTTCGYEPEKGADLFAAGVKRYCKHSALQYHGMLVERFMGYKSKFMTPEKEQNARAFAKELIKKVAG